jgi:Fe-S cluster assembly protein SufD
MSETSFTRAFEERGRELPGPADHHALRRRALDRFGELGLPSRRLETWHYTDLSSLADDRFDFIAPRPDAGALESAARLLAGHAPFGDGSRVVFVDGHRIESLSGMAQDSSVEIEPLPLEQADFAGDAALAALNVAFLAEGSRLRITGKASAPIELVFAGSGRGLAAQVRLAIELDAEAEAVVLIRFIDGPGAAEAWLNLVSDIALGASSRLTLYRLQAHASAQHHTALNRARLAAGAKLEAGSVELGGQLVRNEFEVSLNGSGASAQLFGVELARQRQHCDTRVEIDHRAADTTSRQNYRAIAAESSRCIFNGKVIVRENAQHIDARQRNDNLLLSSRAEIDTKPELEIYADQVICSHGATVGELDENHMFYLQTRGIDAETARGILTTAFAETILERFAHDGFRERARLEVDARLPRTIEIG